MKLPKNWTPDNQDFRAFYGWPDSAGVWSTETAVAQDGLELAVHRFRSASDAGSVDGEARQAGGTLFLIHGYLEHSALRIPLALEGVRAGWEVCGIDLPGHGLSSGDRADIRDFDEYGRALRTVLNHRRWPKPWRMIAHSTGCATTMLHIQKHGNPFEWIVFEAPLVRTFLWEPSLAAKRLLKGAVSTLPRRNAGLPKSRTFYRILMEDPLYISKVPLGWFDALERYEVATHSWGLFPGRFLVLQGIMDTVVDWEYNLSFLRDHIPKAAIVRIIGGRHHLVRDDGPAGVEARELIRSLW